MESIWKKKVLLGTRKEDGVKVYLVPPSWDCDWYWGLGYLGNENEHFHLKYIGENHNLPMWEALLRDYELNPKIKDNIWQFCEAFTSLYTLRDMADLSHRGGSNVTYNETLKETIQNPELATHINGELIPKLLDYIYDLIK